MKLNRTLEELINEKLRLRKEKRGGVDPEPLVSTDMGLLTSDNVQYLLDQNILTMFNDTFAISGYSAYSATLDKPVKNWSLFQFVKEYIQNRYSVKDLNDVVLAMQKEIKNVIAFGLSMQVVRKGGGKSNGWD